MSQSPELTAFYRAYAAWLDAGAPEVNVCFHRGIGLCGNLGSYAQRHGFDTATLGDELDLQFNGEAYPFNADEVEYDYEADCDTSYLNPRRVAWVRAHCETSDDSQ
jgi:hypothetical protein